MKRILIQGAVEGELSYLKEQSCFENAKHQRICGFDFWSACEQPWILSNTRVGMTNAALATMAAIAQFEPEFVINQGTAGAQTTDLRTGDIVIGEKSVNVHSLKMDKRDYGEGMKPESWNGINTEYLSADTELLSKFAEAMGERTATGKVVVGTLGSGDLFSREKDRVLWLHQKFGHLSEDMESFAVYAACHASGIPCLSIRIISNNELLDEDYAPEIAIELQRQIWGVLSHF